MSNREQLQDTQLLYNADETRALLGITKRQLYHLVSRGLIKKHPAFRCLMFQRRAVEKFATGA